MDKKALEAFAIEFAKGIKTEKDLNEFSQTLAKVTIGIGTAVSSRGW